MLNKTFNIFNYLLKGILLILFFIMLFVLITIDILPSKFLIIFIICSIIVLVFNIISDFIFKNKILKILSSLISLIVIVVYSVCLIYIYKTDKFIKNLESDVQIETYYVAVLNDSIYKDISDLNNLKIGTFYSNKDSYDNVVKDINEIISYQSIFYDNLYSICNDLIYGNIDAILLNEQNKYLLEENDSINISLKYIYKFITETKVSVVSKDLDVTEEPFILYITGIDTYGEISNVARSDVNVIATVNPKTRKILLITIPRDYYVQLHGTTGRKDILTHAGLYGVDMSVSTLEDLLDIDINYYVRLNFSTLIKAIDIIGGIDVYSEYDFNTYGYQFYKGYNTVNGEYALAFSRARKNFDGGDKQRGKNQLLVIEAIIKKISTSSSLLNNYLEILSSLDGTFQTNIDSKSIYALVKMQLSDMTEWNIEKYSLDGINGQDYTYTLGDIIAFVMEPDYNTVNEAKNKIQEMFIFPTKE